MTYATYEYYLMEYSGTAIDEGDFLRLAKRASSYLDYYTKGKAAAHSDLDAMKMACCALAEQYQQIEQARNLALGSLTAAALGGGEVQSESVGSYSVTRRSGGDSALSAQNAAQALSAALPAIAAEYLAVTGLLYRGGGCTCTRHIL